MNTAIMRAAEVAGSIAALARQIGVSAPAVHEWRNDERPVPIERCVQIEQATGGAVRRWDLRPTDWHRIWPELVSFPGAPTPHPEPARAE